MKKIFATSLLIFMMVFLSSCTAPNANDEQTIISEGNRWLIEQVIRAVADPAATVAIGDVVGTTGAEFFSKDIAINSNNFLMCPLPYGDSDIMVKFSDYNSRAWQGLISDGRTWQATLPWIYSSDVYIPPGKYDIFLAAYDSYPTRRTTDPAHQNKEQVMMEMAVASGWKQRSNPTGDLRDGYNTALWSGMVNGEDTNDAYIIVHSPERIRVMHSEYYSVPTQWANSIYPICAVFKKLPFPEKECPFTATGEDVLVEFNGTASGNVGIRSDKTISDAEQVVNINIPVGNYKISLASYDGSMYRKNYSQDKESYYLKFRDSNGIEIGNSTNASADLEDYVNIATWSGEVESSFVVPAGVDAVVAQHSAYSDVSNANSMVPICALFEKNPDCTPNWTYSCVETPSPVECTYPENCGQTIAISRSCLREDSSGCEEDNTVDRSECVANSVPCAEPDTITCDSCPDIINWIEKTP